MGDRHIYRKVKVKVLSLCFLDTMAMAGKLQEKLKVCENNRVRTIAGVRRIGRLRWEDCIKRDLVGVGGVMNEGEG